MGHIPDYLDDRLVSDFRKNQHAYVEGVSGINVEVKILNEMMRDKFLIRKNFGDAGFDLSACIDKELILNPGECKLINTGIAIYIKNPNYVGLVYPRSGLGHKNGLVLGNLTGVIDSGYQGEIKVSLWNRGNVTQSIQPFDRIAQIVFTFIQLPHFTVVEEFESSERSEGGFGSTGNQ